MSEKTLGASMEEQLTYKKKNVFESADAERTAEIFAYAEGYMRFLDQAKTEREATAAAIAMARENGYTEYRFGDALAAGDKRYFCNRGKSVILFRVGREDPEIGGIRILASHIDSPRLDLKQVPLYEDSGMGFFKTHYYGGIKKYQWTAIPLALHGVVVTADGSTVEISVGEKETDPVFCITDLLPHLAQKQSAESLSTAIKGEQLNILVGGLPYDDEDVIQKVKLTVLSMLHESYGMTEEDFITAELSLVPAYRARDIGFDRSMIGAYGHDDRVCAYPSLTALFTTESDLHTQMVILADKEETGSTGATGMQSDVLTDIIAQISEALGKNPVKVRAASMCISADVTAAYDPTFPEVYEKANSALVSCGVCMSKYTGSRGKSDTNDADAEFIAFLRRTLAAENILWQSAELGRVDVGGGGTVAKYISKHNINTVDMGVPVLSMHAPLEVVSKADVYSAHLAFCAFLK